MVGSAYVHPSLDAHLQTRIYKGKSYTNYLLVESVQTAKSLPQRRPDHSPQAPLGTARLMM